MSKMTDQIQFWSQMELDQYGVRILLAYVLVTCGELPF